MHSEGLTAKPRRGHREAAWGTPRRRVGVAATPRGTGRRGDPAVAEPLPLLTTQRNDITPPLHLLTTSLQTEPIKPRFKALTLAVERSVKRERIIQQREQLAT